MCDDDDTTSLKQTTQPLPVYYLSIGMSQTKYTSDNHLQQELLTF
jgi:hypothetical protein